MSMPRFQKSQHGRIIEENWKLPSLGKNIYDLVVMHT